MSNVAVAAPAPLPSLPFTVRRTQPGFHGPARAPAVRRGPVENGHRRAGLAAAGIARQSVEGAWHSGEAARDHSTAIAAAGFAAAGQDADAEDRAQLTRVAAGDAGALAALYDRHAARLMALAVRILGGAGEAEEVLQETFLQAWRSASRYNAERCSVRGWLILIARSRALDRLRSGSSRRRREEVLMIGGPLAQMPVGCARLETSDRARALRRALLALPPEQRQAIELAFYEGLTHTEVAERLGAPLGTVKSRILLGMRKLRDELSPLAD